MTRTRRRFASGKEIIHEGDTEHRAFVLLEGWVSSFKILRDGSRQIVDFQIAGDFIGMRSVLLRTVDHNVEPITDIVAASIHLDEVMELFSSQPRVAAAMMWALSADEAIVVERLVSVGRRHALERVAHFLLEMRARLRLVGMGRQQSFPCPLTQYHLADALGLSAVHVNRVLRQLREDTGVTFRGGVVKFGNIDRAMETANCDMGYLDHGGLILE
nr:Crp/Fnr family transcriptional regulator [Jannaschia faecimaris]